ncbi:hypothetical protein CON48_22635 [Bacillus thuringiensis]|uniref:Gastrin/cholecystokinin peptide hormone domain-containing protein n=1 Tax=Bacillus thuringiensis TaxID=1428 RepID=A0ABD6SPW7_BACTU|nr:MULTISPECIES: hypothetical protein [Bacillus]AJQ61869.1 hypothetical protein SD98_27450 [Bacillus thuringiensis serovar morrisoni]AMR87571.1 hypothetical protein A3L20_27260 [Bacillus thuringiensis]MBG9640647.1 hypothetical protein [Bacillus thuringiensis]MBG9676315.1 hypothetical protein [Bacillus thuringiensis]MBJ8087434.1 hypothetical protein [Bacillus cereus]
MNKKKGSGRPVSKKNKAYWEAKERLEKVQAKYIQKPKKNSSKPMSNKEKQSAELRAKKRYNDRVWKGWRETDGVTYPVTGSDEKSASKKK